MLTFWWGSLFRVPVILFFTKAGNSQFVAGHPYLFEGVESFIWDASRKINQAVIIVDANTADTTAGDVRLIGNGTDNISGHDPMVMTQGDTIAFHPFGGWTIISFALGWPSSF